MPTKTIKKPNNIKLLLKLAGSWNLNDKEAKKLNEDIRRGWKKWKIKYI